MTKSFIPTIIISGFLGAGKTTLINNILNKIENKRVVVYVNDFGDINIDVDLIDTIEADRVSLKNGCVCCSLNEELISSISNLVNESPKPDAIVIEASGVSDGRSLISSLDALEAAGLLRLDATVCVVDPDTCFNLAYDDLEGLIDQAAASDLILLNKVDICSSQHINKIRSLLAEVAPFSKVIETTYCDVPLDIFLGFETNKSEHTSHIKIKNKQRKININHAHSKKFSSQALTTKQLLNRTEFEKFIRTLPDICIRAKGILYFSCQPSIAYVFNMVGTRASIHQKALKDDSSESKLLVIGYTDKIKNTKVTVQFDRIFCESA